MPTKIVVNKFWLVREQVKAYGKLPVNIGSRLIATLHSLKLKSELLSIQGGLIKNFESLKYCIVKVLCHVSQARLIQSCNFQANLTLWDGPFNKIHLKWISPPAYHHTASISGVAESNGLQLQDDLITGGPQGSVDQHLHGKAGQSVFSLIAHSNIRVVIRIKCVGQNNLNMNHLKQSFI
jgi:hypothetical protein